MTSLVLTSVDVQLRHCADYHAACARSTKARFEKVIRAAQDSICAAISEIDGTPFRQDAWTRADGGGGITRVMQGKQAGPACACHHWFNIR